MLPLLPGSIHPRFAVVFKEWTRSANFATEQKEMAFWNLVLTNEKKKKITFNHHECPVMQAREQYILQTKFALNRSCWCLQPKDNVMLFPHRTSSMPKHIWSG